MTPKGADLEATDLIEVSTIESGSYVTRSITGQELIDAIPLPPTGLTIGTTPIASGTIGRVLFQGTGNVLQQSSSLFWDSTNNRLGIGTSSPATGTSLDVNGRIKANIISADAVNNTLNTVTLLQFSATGNRLFDNSGTQVVNVRGGNIQIGTNTDAGFRLDVNGTARVTGDFRITKSTFSSLLAFNSGAFGSSAEYFDLAYPINGGLRCIPNFSGSIDGAAFQCFGGTATSFAGQMYFDYGSNARNISGRSANWRNASLAGFTNVLTLTANSNVLINTTTDAGFRLDVNGTARVSGNLTVGDNTQIGWGNGNYIVANNATPSITLFLQSSVAATFSASGICTIPVIRTSSGGISPTTDNAQDLGGQFGRFRHGWIGGQLKVGDATAVNASAKVQVDSTTQGFLPPRMTTTQKNAIASPATGLQVYDTTLNRPCFYDGTTWITL
jgi:hypothetical protein